MQLAFVKTKLAFLVWNKRKKSLVLEKKKFISNTTELICLYSRKEILMKDEELFHLYTFDIPIRNKAVFSTIFLLYSFQTLYLLYNLKYAQNYVLFRITNNKRDLPTRPLNHSITTHVFTNFGFNFTQRSHS